MANSVHIINPVIEQQTDYKGAGGFVPGYDADFSNCHNAGVPLAIILLVTTDASGVATVAKSEFLGKPPVAGVLFANEFEMGYVSEVVEDGDDYNITIKKLSDDSLYASTTFDNGTDPPPIFGGHIGLDPFASDTVQSVAAEIPATNANGYRVVHILDADYAKTMGFPDNDEVQTGAKFAADERVGTFSQFGDSVETGIDYNAIIGAIRSRLITADIITMAELATENRPFSSVDDVYYVETLTPGSEVVILDDGRSMMRAMVQYRIVAPAGRGTFASYETAVEIKNSLLALRAELLGSTIYVESVEVVGSFVDESTHSLPIRINLTIYSK